MKSDHILNTHSNTLRMRVSFDADWLQARVEAAKIPQFPAYSGDGQVNILTSGQVDFVKGMIAEIAKVISDVCDRYRATGFTDANLSLHSYNGVAYMPRIGSDGRVEFVVVLNSQGEGMGYPVLGSAKDEIISVCSDTLENHFGWSTKPCGLNGGVRKEPDGRPRKFVNIKMSP